jgi:hypothetical protein
MRPQGRVGLKAAPDVRASCSARRREGFSVRSHEIPHGHRRLPGQFGDGLVFAREDAVLIVEGDRAEVLDHELRQACLLETLPILGNGQWLVADLSAQHVGDGRGNSGLIQLSRSAEGIGLPDMSGRLRQDGRDNPRLARPRSWSRQVRRINFQRRSRHIRFCMH